MRVTDAPNLAVTAIVVTASKIETHATGAAEDAWETVVEGPIEFDLLQVVGREESLGLSELEPGTYTQTRIHVDSVLITENGEEKEAQVPSEIIRLVRPLEIVAGETTIVTFDFDADASVVSAGPNLIFKPTVKLLVRGGDEPFVPEEDEAPEPTPTAEPTATPTVTPSPTPTPAPDEFVLNISSPLELESIVSVATVTVSGQTRADAALSVNDAFLEPDIDGLFSTEVALDLGPNTIEIVASIAGGEELSVVYTVIYIPGG